MPQTKHHKYHGPNVIFQGTIGAQKRLVSAHLEVLRIAMYRGGMGFVWEAETNHGRRWVSYSARNGWKISKTPPVAAEPTAHQKVSA